MLSKKVKERIKRNKYWRKRHAELRKRYGPNWRSVLDNGTSIMMVPLEPFLTTHDFMEDIPSRNNRVAQAMKNMPQVKMKSEFVFHSAEQQYGVHRFLSTEKLDPT